MAPRAAVGREAAIEAVAKGRLPVWLGSPHQCAVILEQDGRFRVRDLLIDEEEARAAGEAALARGENWMPEHYYALGKPVGTVHADAATLDELAALIARMDWPRHW